MPDLRELYQETILDHSKRPRNFHEIPEASATAVGHNPLCGDRVTVYLRLSDGTISDIAFVGQGCAISKASASLMTDAVKGKSETQAHELFQKFHKMVTARPTDPVDTASLGKLAVLSGVCEFPVRVKCATLPWHTMRSALNGAGATVSTEGGAEASPKEEPVAIAGPPPKVC
ncbi:MAG TPA: SUF system NifU family Fe-S cluster assembly protein [Thermoanaerobaculia bacterium]